MYRNIYLSVEAYEGNSKISFFEERGGDPSEFNYGLLFFCRECAGLDLNWMVVDLERRESKMSTFLWI